VCFIKQISVAIIIVLILCIIGILYFSFRNSYFDYIVEIQDTKDEAINSENVYKQNNSSYSVEDNNPNSGEDNNSSLTEDIVEEINVDATNSYKIIILGLDTRADDYKGRSDLMILMDLNHITQEVKLISFMRDLRVSIEGHGQTKLGHAYAYGKERLVIKTYYENFALEIDEHITLNFDSLKEIIDAIDGVTISVNDKEADNISGVDGAGEYLMNGKQVLSYVRIRNTGNGDFERTERQRDVLEKIMSKLSTLTNEELLITINEVYPLLNTSIDIDEIYDQIYAFREVDDHYEVTTKRVPSGTNFKEKMIDGIYYLVINDMAVLVNELKLFLQGE